MLYLSYNADPARDPWANSSQLGAGAVPLQFSESCRPDLSAPAAVAGVNRNVSFTSGDCDHYGNVDGELQSMAPSADSPGARFTFWLPDTPIEDDASLPAWVRDVAAGRKLVRPAQGVLPAWAVPAEDGADAQPRL